MRLVADLNGQSLTDRSVGDSRSSPVASFVYGARMDSSSDVVEPGGGVEVHRSGNGLMVSGSSTEVAAFIEQISAVAAETRGQVRRLSADGVAAAATVAALVQTHAEYVQCTDRAMSLVRDHGAVPNGNGSFWGFVREGHEFAGNLDWRQVNLSPERALSLQAFAGQYALRAAIKDVADAIERVEGKVDRLVELARADRLGSAAGDRQTLLPIAERVQQTGQISLTDWSTITSLGQLISRDIQSLRAYIERQLRDVKDSPLARARAEEAQDLADEMLKESIALLVVVEQNLALWQECKLAQVATREPEELGRTIEDLAAHLDQLARNDQALVTGLHDVVGRLLAPTGYEGFAPLQKAKLRKYADELDQVAAWFCEQRTLDPMSREVVEMPDLGDSVAKARGAVVAGAKWTRGALASNTSRLRRRNERPDELGSGDTSETSDS